MAICGDARGVMDLCIPPQSLEEVFINFPEPPVYEDSAYRLVDDHFLR